MTTTEFRDLVERMRDAQRAYFRERKPQQMIDAKTLEREVDAAVKRLKDPQPTLFD